MANPVLSEKVFSREATVTESGIMTIKGTILKSLTLLFMVLAGASYSWKLFTNSLNPEAVTPWLIGGSIGGFVVALLISFKPKRAQYLAPLYALLQGLFLGGISAIFSETFADVAPGIVTNAVLLTMMVTLSMLLLYNSNLVKVDSRFARVITIAIASIAFYYLISIVLSLFGVNLTLLHNSGPLSIGISIVIVIVAALSLLLDFQFIERGSAMGMPKYMEWYGAFALMVTLIWLYLEILKLLSKFASRREQ